MMQLIGTIVCLAGIAWLFYMDRDPDASPAPALWIPTIWLLITGSRSVTEWLSMRPQVSLAQQFSDSSPIDAAVYASLIAAGLVVLNSRSIPVRGFLRQNLPLVLFVAFCALSVLWSDAPFIAFKRWTKSVGDLVMVIIVLTDPRPVAALRTLFKRIAFVLLPLSVLFIICFPNLGSGYSPEDMTWMYFGVTTFKNLLGMIAMVCGLFSFWSLLCAYEDRSMRNRRGHIAAHLIIFITACWLIIKADSMTSLACLALAGAVLVLVGQRSVLRWQAGVPLVLIFFLAVPAIAVFFDPLGPLLHSLGRNSTITGRTLIWQTVLSLQTSPWFGAGFESFWLGPRLERIWHMSVNGIQEAHNGYIEVYLNLGWCGVILLSAVILSGYSRAIAALRRDRQEGRLRLAVLTAALIFSMTEAGFRMLSPIWIALLLAASERPAIRAASTARKMPEFFRQRAAPKEIRILQ